MEITFENWIKTKKSENNAVGDLARDVSEDKNFPQTNKQSDVLYYLESVGACCEAIDTFKEAWGIYENEV